MCYTMMIFFQCLGSNATFAVAQIVTKYLARPLTSECGNTACLKVYDDSMYNNFLVCFALYNEGELFYQVMMLSR